MSDSKPVVRNREASHNYAFLETFVAGIALKGTEVKSLRAGKANLKDSYARMEGGEAFLYNMHISPYEHGSIYNVDPRRRRKLLLRKEEITRLIGQTVQKGLTIVPTQVYFSRRGFAKVELAVARGKRQYDKRHTIREREARRELARVVKGKRH